MMKRNLRLEALAGQPQAFAADYAVTAAGSVETWVERIIEYASDNAGIICVASTEEESIGMMGLVRGPWPKTRHNGIDPQVICYNDVFYDELLMARSVG